MDIFVLVSVYSSGEWNKFFRMGGEEMCVGAKKQVEDEEIEGKTRIAKE